MHLKTTENLLPFSCPDEYHLRCFFPVSSFLFSSYNANLPRALFIPHSGPGAIGSTCNGLWDMTYWWSGGLELLDTRAFPYLSSLCSNAETGTLQGPAVCLRAEEKLPKAEQQNFPSHPQTACSLSLISHHPTEAQNTAVTALVGLIVGCLTCSQARAAKDRQQNQMSAKLCHSTCDVKEPNTVIPCISSASANFA